MFLYHFLKYGFNSIWYTSVRIINAYRQSKKSHKFPLNNPKAFAVKANFLPPSVLIKDLPNCTYIRTTKPAGIYVSKFDLTSLSPSQTPWWIFTLFTSN